MKNFKKYLYVTCAVSAMIFSFAYSDSFSRVCTASTQIADASDEFVIEGTVLAAYKGTNAKVTVPEGITVIGKKAFSSTLAEEIILPDSVTELEDYAFYSDVENTSKIKKITFGNNIQKIGKKAIGFYSKSSFYLNAYNKVQNKTYDWMSSSLKLYGPINSPVKEYADTYGIAYNDEFVCRMDAGHASTRYESTASLVLYWDAQYSADGYYVCRSQTAAGPFEQIKAIPQDEETPPEISYYDKGLAPDKTYYYQVRSYRKSLKDDSIIISDTYAGAYRKPRLSPLHFTLVQIYPASLEITVPKPTGSDAEGYYVFRADKPDGEYKKIATVEGFSNYIDKKLVIGKPYYYKLTAYKGKYTSPASDVVKKRILPGIVKSIHAKWLSSGSARITWKEVKNCDGYILYRASDSLEGSSNYKRVRLKTFTKNQDLACKDKGLAKGFAYEYSIRAYKLYKGKKIYGRLNYVYLYPKTK